MGNDRRFSQHMRQTVVIAAPIALALLSEIGTGLISTVMLGGVSARALAAGALGANVFITLLLILQGVLSGVGVLAANRIGGGRVREVPELYWSGVLLAVLLAAPMFAALSLPPAAWRAMGQPPLLAADLSFYLHILRWGVPAGIVGIGMMRQFLPAVGLQHVLSWVLPGGLVLDLVLNLVLVRGVFGFHGYGLGGSAACFVITLSATAITMLAILHRPRFAHFVRLARPSAPSLGRLLAIGLPVSGAVVVEMGLFLVAGMLAGALGPSVLAAHMIALSVASVTFMVPLAISQAANVRVASAMGAGDRPQARRAGLAAIAVALAFMSAAALVISSVPALIAGLYLPANAANAATAALATRLLRIAGVFQMADGTQVTASGALRGLEDVRVPMLMATIGYWGIGFWAGWYLAFRAHLGAVGLWWGLCAGLGAVAVLLTGRFLQKSDRKEAVLF
jgi:MATE family multidrug resistance protein